MNTPSDNGSAHSQPPLRSTFTAGMIIAGRYRLVSRIGDGGMGVVWSALNIFTDREVALKFISTPDEEFRRRLQREARACGALNHRNVIDVYDLVQSDNGEPVLVMQLLQGETLADLLRRRRRLEPPLAAHIGRDIAAALAAIHDLKVVHRDLKPANIFLHQEPGGGRPIVKVLDFGVSKRLAAGPTQRTAPGIAVGSISYMSPEQIRASSEVDPRADIWSLGVILFELLTGSRPFQGDISSILTQILQGEIPRVSRFVRHVDPALVELVAGCMCRDRDQRLGPAERIATALDSFASVGDPWCQPTPVSEPIPPRPQAPLRADEREVVAVIEDDDDETATRRMPPIKLLPNRPSPSHVAPDEDELCTIQAPLPSPWPAPVGVQVAVGAQVPVGVQAPVRVQAPPFASPVVGRIPQPPNIAGPAGDAFGTVPLPPRPPLPSAPFTMPGVVAPRRRGAFFAAAAGLTVATGAGGAGLVASLLPQPPPPLVAPLKMPHLQIPRPAEANQPVQSSSGPSSSPRSVEAGSGGAKKPSGQTSGGAPGSSEAGTKPPQTAHQSQQSLKSRSGAPAVVQCEKAKFLDRNRCTTAKLPRP